jgi:hypothetical protein
MDTGDSIMLRKTESVRSVCGRFCMVALVAIVASLGAPKVEAIERYIVPDESASGPFYARLEQGFVHMTDQWVAVAFYREPSCVRAGFNLLDFFDFANIPAIFGCPLTVHGLEIWKNGVASDTGPMQSKLFGNGAVPVWFVSVSDFNDALPGVTLEELLGMGSLRKGYATFFEETLHPAGAARQTMLHISSYGWLEDGASFQYEATEAGGRLTTVRIKIR